MPVWFETLWQDVRYAARQLRKTPGFALVAVLTLALGIGANTAVFSVMNSVLMASLPVKNPQELVYLHTNDFPGGQTGYGDTAMRMQVFEALRKENRVFSDLMAWVPLSVDSTVAVRLGDAPEIAKGDMVSGNYLSGLGVRLVRGRGFSMDDETRHTQTVVLSYDYWTRRFGRGDVLGRAMYIKGVPFTIIGVAAPGFVGTAFADVDFWVPFQIIPDIKPWGSSANDKHDVLYGGKWWFLLTIGRLQPGVTIQQAESALQPVFAEAAYEGNADAPRDPNDPIKLRLTAARGVEVMKDMFAKPIRILMAMVLLVLAIACGNVAMLLVARNAARQREFCLRMAVGGSRARLFRQLLTESAMIVLCGAAAGWLFAMWATRALAAWSRFEHSLAPDLTVLGFTLAVSVVVALVFGLAPLRAAINVPIALALKTGAAASHQDHSRRRGGQAVIAVQMAFCLVLLVGAGLLVRTLRNLDKVNLGMKASGLLVFGLNPAQHAHTKAEYLQFYQAVIERMRRIPGVESVTLVSNRPGAGWSSNQWVFVDGRQEKLPDGRNASVRVNRVGADFVRTMGMTLRVGRDFNDGDTPNSPKVAIVNQTFVDKYLGGSAPVGHTIATDGGPDAMQYSIAGVVADAKYTSVREEPRPMAYLPYTQSGNPNSMQVELRTAGSPMAFLGEARRAANEIAPDLPLFQPTTQDEQFDQSLSQDRLFARLASFFGALAVLLVATGLYGTLAYKVARRTPEIGVRMALGAQQWQVLWMILRESLLLGCIGAVVGLPVAIGASRLMRSMLFGLQPGDPLTFAIALAGVAMVALAASFLPARKASSVDPMIALRCE